ncbi:MULTISPECIES: thioesterase family protein [unclassified Sphingomonas]|uniref:acyl-CoA thioesterase n=1 Tax=Sphingomonas TaxID=13687 RepID=UPI00095BB719|nr:MULTISPECIES: acyl-CoA thioesterase [unclassified Sphingomonas]MBN8810472.1 acyl-CoA thioesterase [Sphingomonas sp.]OJY50996.1 MAG: thioesterase [Sphingomonas sp. 67-41]
MASYSATITAGPGDIDELGHVNNAVWVKWIQDVAVAHWHAVAAPEHAQAYIWVVTRHEIDYRGNVAEGETVTALTWVPEPPRGARFDRHMKFTGADGKVRVEAKTTWAILDRASGRLIRVPAEVAAPFLS